MTTLSLSCSRKVYELLGDTYETEFAFYQRGSYFCGKDYIKESEPEAMRRQNGTLDFPWKCLGPAYSFAETVRLLPRITEKKGWRDYVNRSEESGHGMWDTLEDMTCFFVEAQTEEEGMAKVSEYLEKIL